MSKIGIIGAMDIEVALLKKEMTIDRIVKRARMEFFEGTLCNAKVVVVRSGIGKVNAALCVQILADVFEVTHIINTGAAGSLNAELDIEDILISKDAIYHDMDATDFGYPIGEVPQMGIREFPADEKLIALAKTCFEKTTPERHAIVGRVLTGDLFVSKSNVKEYLIDTFHGDCTEMEGAAIAHGAYLNNIPFVIIRSISDKADESVAVSYDIFEKIAAENSAKLVKEMIQYI